MEVGQIRRRKQELSGRSVAELLTKATWPWQQRGAFSDLIVASIVAGLGCWVIGKGLYSVDILRRRRDTIVASSLGPKRGASENCGSFDGAFWVLILNLHLFLG